MAPPSPSLPPSPFLPPSSSAIPSAPSLPHSSSSSSSSPPPPPPPSARGLHHKPRSFATPLSSLDPNVLRSGSAQQLLPRSSVFNSTEDHNVLNADRSHCKQISYSLISDGNENDSPLEGKENQHKRVKRKPLARDKEFKFARISLQAEELGISTTSTVTSDRVKNIGEELNSKQSGSFTSVPAPSSRLRDSEPRSNLLKREHDPVSCTKDVSSVLNSSLDQGSTLSTTSRPTIIDEYGKINVHTRESYKPPVHTSLQSCSKPPTYPRRNRFPSQKPYQNSSVLRYSMIPSHSVSNTSNLGNVIHSVPTFRELQCSTNTSTVDSKVQMEGIERSTVDSRQQSYVPYDLQGSVRSQKCSSKKSMVHPSRERQPRKSNLCPLSQRKEYVSNFHGIAVPTGITGELNPGIIRNIRTKKQVRSVIEAIIGSSSSSDASNSSVQKKRDRIQCTTEDCGDKVQSSYSKMEEDSGAIGLTISHLESNALINKTVKEEVQMHSLWKERSPEVSLEAIDVRRHDEVASQASWIDDHGVGWKHSVSDSSISKDSCDTTDLSAWWLELLRLDLKGRLSALKRSRRRVRGVIASSNFDKVTTSERNIFSGKDCQTEEMQKWKDFFLNMDGALCSEGARLEKWLRQVVEMQPFCQKKGFVLPQWDLATCRMGEAMPSNMGSATCMFPKATPVTS